MTTHIQGKSDFSIEKSTLFAKWLWSNDALRTSKECLPQQKFSKFRTGWVSVEKIAVTGIRKHLQLTSWGVDCTVQTSLFHDLNCRYFNFLLRLTVHFPWASSRTWKCWAHDQPETTLELPSLLQWDVTLANWSRQERDSVSQNPSEEQCWHSESVTVQVCQGVWF